MGRCELPKKPVENGGKIHPMDCYWGFNMFQPLNVGATGFFWPIHSMCIEVPFNNLIISGGLEHVFPHILGNSSPQLTNS